MGQNDYMDQTGYMGQSGYMQPGYAQPNPYEYSQPVQPGFTVPTYAFQNGPAKYPQYDTTNGKRCTAMEVVGLVLAIVSVTLCLITLIFGFAKAAFGMAIPSLAISALGLLFSVISVFSIM